LCKVLEDENEQQIIITIIQKIAKEKRKGIVLSPMVIAISEVIRYLRGMATNSITKVCRVLQTILETCPINGW
jgi:hypothetical protein